MVAGAPEGRHRLALLAPCRPAGARGLVTLGFYSDAAPTALGLGEGITVHRLHFRVRRPARAERDALPLDACGVARVGRFGTGRFARPDGSQREPCYHAGLGGGSFWR